MVSAAPQVLDMDALSSRLSSQATISSPNSVARWSEYYAPSPSAVVNVASELDVAQTIQYANSHNIPFLASNGAVGWSTTLGKLQGGIIINLAGLKAINFNPDKTRVTLQGGALISDVVAAAAANNALVATGVCNCVGMLGAVLSGGVGNLMGQYGLGVDNILSLNVVTPDGEPTTVDSVNNPELWFALRGAGPNFGIVTSATLKSYPVTRFAPSVAWLGPLIFPPNKLEPLIQAIDQLALQPKMAIQLIFSGSGNPSAPPIIIFNVFYHGTEAEGKAAYASIYAVGPVADKTAVTRYTKWNAGADIACTKGGRKPNFAAGLNRMDPVTWRAVYDQLQALTQLSGAEHSSVLMHGYPLAAAQRLASDGASYPFRDKLIYNAAFTPSYTDPKFDATAQAFGFKVRDLWRETSGLKDNQTYINNAYGDEDLKTVYGQSLQRLQAIKRVVDPDKRFNYWFPLS